MLKNHVLVAMRTLLRNKAASLIKIISLSVGLICFAIISLFVYHELSYDRFHDHPEQIYRVVKDFVNDDGSTIPDATTPPALAPALWREVPEVASATRVFPPWGRKYLLEVGNDKHYEEQVVRIDSSFFEVFSFPFVQGDKRTAMADPNFILLTRSTARRYFSDTDPIGRTIKIDVSDEGTIFTVTGILEDIPETSHFTFDFLIPVRSFQYSGLDTNWGWYNFYTYVRVKKRTDPAAFNAKLQPLYNKYNPEYKTRYYAQALTDIHLKSNLKWELSANGDASYLKILSIIAIFAVLLAAINYINLVTAQSARRAKEVGVRKVAGAGHGLLIRQFLMESAVLSLAATLVSLAVAVAILPLFSDLFHANLNFFDPQNLRVLWIVIGVGLATGLLAGIYPAFYLSSFRPANMLKGAFSRSAPGAYLRKGLVTFQFVISTVLIIGAMVISQQIDFIRNKKLGFDKENILMIQNAGGLSDLEAVLQELRGVGGVVDAGGADGVIGGQNWTNGANLEGSENSVLLNFLCTDYNFLNVMHVDLAEGRNFSRAYGTDSTAIIINETAARQMGISGSALGKRIAWYTDENGNTVYNTIIGVISDFHFSSFHEPIKPFCFVLYQRRINTLFVKMAGGDVMKTVAAVENIWKRLVPDRPFDFTFEDEQVAKLYANERTFQSLFSYFTVMAIVIACLGLFGLSAEAAQQRTKEIGIRKVLGASLANLAGMLSRDFLTLVILAIVVSIPLGWYTMSRWLEGFAYRMEFSAWIFVWSAILAIAIGLLTVSFQSVKAALTNPVDSLRNE